MSIFIRLLCVTMFILHNCNVVADSFDKNKSFLKWHVSTEKEAISYLEKMAKTGYEINLSTNSVDYITWIEQGTIVDLAGIRPDDVSPELLVRTFFFPAINQDRILFWISGEEWGDSIPLQSINKIKKMMHDKKYVEASSELLHLVDPLCPKLKLRKKTKGVLYQYRSVVNKDKSKRYRATLLTTSNGRVVLFTIAEL